MRRGKTNSLVQGSWKRPPRRLRLRRPWQKSLPSNLLGSGHGIMINLIYVVFYQKAPLRSTAAGLSAATNHTSHSRTDHRRNPRPSSPPVQYKPNPPSRFCTIVQNHHNSIVNTPNSRQINSLSPSLGTDHFRSMDIGGGERVPPGVLPPSLPVIPTSHSGQVNPRSTADRGGGEDSSTETGSDQGHPLPRAVCEQNLPGSKERWFFSSSDKLEATECFHSKSPLQDGGDRYAQRLTTSFRLDVFHRSQGCIPFSEHLSGTPPVPSLHLEGDLVRVHLPTLRTMQCSKDFHKVDETRDGLPAGQGI